MKITLLLVTLATGFLVPAVTHADAPASKSKRVTTVAAVKPAAATQRETVYIGKTYATGSHIPTVWRGYNGRMETPSNLRVYGESDLNRAGQIDVASQLTMVDPGISLSRGYR